MDTEATDKTEAMAFIEENFFYDSFPFVLGPAIYIYSLVRNKKGRKEHLIRIE